MPVTPKAVRHLQDSDEEMLALLDRVLEQSAAIDPQHSITVVDRTRIRRHPLPVQGRPSA